MIVVPMTDSLYIPIPDGAPLRSLTVCGSLREESGSIEDQERHYAIFKYGSDADSVFVRIIVGAGGSHLHVDVLRPECFARGEPKPEGDKMELLERLSQYFGRDIDAMITASFAVGEDELPAAGLVRASMLKTTIGKTTVEQSAATFSFGEGPIDRLDWSKRKDDDDNRIMVSIEMPAILTVDTDYLARASKRVTDAFSTAVLGRKTKEE